MTVGNQFIAAVTTVARELTPATLKTQKNANRLLKKFRLVNYGWLAMLGRHEKDEFVSLSKAVLRDANLKLTRKMDDVFTQSPSTLAFVTNGDKPRRRNLMAFNRMLKYFVKEDDILMTNIHELRHGFHFKRKLQFISDESSGVVVGIRNFLDTVTPQFFNLSKRAQHFAIKTQGMGSREKTIEEAKALLKVQKYLLNRKYVRNEVLRLLREQSDEVLTRIKGQGLMEFDAIDSSLKIAKEMKLKINLNQELTYRLLHEKLNNWVRIVEKERRSSAKAAVLRQTTP